MRLTPGHKAALLLGLLACRGEDDEGGRCRDRCRREDEGELLEATQKATMVELGVPTVLREMGIDDVCDSRVVLVTLGGISRAGCRVEGMQAYVAWHSYPDFGEAVHTEVYFPVTKVCGVEIGGLGAGEGIAFDGTFYVAPDEDGSSNRVALRDPIELDDLLSLPRGGYGLRHAEHARAAVSDDDPLVIREIALAENEDGTAVGIIGDVAPAADFEVLGGGLYELLPLEEGDESESGDVWPGYVPDPMTEILGGALDPRAEVTLPGC